MHDTSLQLTSFFHFWLLWICPPPKKKLLFPGQPPHHIAHATRHRSQLAISCLYLEGSSFRHPIFQESSSNHPGFQGVVSVS